LVVAVLIGTAPMMTPGWRKGAIIATVTLAVLLVFVALAQDARDKRRGSELRRLRTEHDKCSNLAEEAARQAAAEKDAEYLDYLAWLCKDRLAMLQHQITACFSATTAPERRKKISKARNSIVHAAAELVGNVDKGTRANVFKLIETADGSEEMVPEDFWGRGDQSTRVFRPGMATFDEAMAGRSRFHAQTDGKDNDTGELLAYETYLTFPIKEGTGTLYGILTVDCLHEGELSKDLDTARMSVLAAMLALTYRAEYVRPASASASA